MTPGAHRPTHCTISYHALRHNFSALKYHLPRGTQAAAVVAADAYGHGAVSVAKNLESYYDHPDAFHVAISDEALALRDAGITLPIVVLGLTDLNDAWLHAKRDITVTINERAWLEHAYRQKPEDAPALHIYLAVDTGMGRIGVPSIDEANEIIAFIAAHPDAFVLDGIVTEHATAADLSMAARAYTVQQLGAFDQLKAALDLGRLPKRPLFSQANSSIALWRPEHGDDLVRLGSALYGINPSNGAVPLPDDLELLPALRFETALSWIQYIERPTAIGDGATYTAEAGEWIGTLPVGYADGLNRALTGFDVLVMGQRCPIVGRIGMNQTTIRLPGYVPLDTPVTLIGTERGQTNTLEMMAQAADTLPQAIACGISPRVPREFGHLL